LSFWKSANVSEITPRFGVILETFFLGILDCCDMLHFACF